MQVVYLAGLPRCGSSWACRALAAAFQSDLIDEPFNFVRFPERRVFFQRYIPRGCDDPDIAGILRADIRKFRPWWRPWKWSRRFVIKDVHAYFAIERVYETFHCPMLVLIRNPFDLAASHHRLGYGEDGHGQTMFNQKRLVDDIMRPFKAHFESRDDYFFRAGTYWGGGYYVIQTLCDRIPGAQIVRFEDLCADSLTGFRRIAERMGLGFSDAGAAFLEKHNRTRGEGENEYSINRVARDEVGKWKEQLTAEEVRQVREGALPFGVMQKYYPELCEP